MICIIRHVTDTKTDNIVLLISPFVTATLYLFYLRLTYRNFFRVQSTILVFPSYEFPTNFLFFFSRLTLNGRTLWKYLICLIRQKNRKICFRHALRRVFIRIISHLSVFFRRLLIIIRKSTRSAFAFCAVFNVWRFIFIWQALSFGQRVFGLTLPTHTIQHVHQRTYGDRY